MKKFITAAVAGLALLTGQAVAGNGTALSAGDRIGAPSTASSDSLEGGNTLWIVGGLVLAAILIGVIVSTNDDDEPASP